MSDPTLETDADFIPNDLDEGRLVRVCYVLCLLGWLLGITTWVALIIAYFAQSRGPVWVQGHYRFIIRTFWLPLVGFAVAALPWLLLASVSQALAYATLFLGMALAFLWIVTREITGLKRVSKGLPLSNPKSLMFGN